MNVLTVLGVVAFGWPAGNVFILFWVENAVIGAWNVVRVVTARGTGGPEPRITINGRPTTGTPAVLALFFCFHYGLFCLVHAVFTGFVAYHLGIEATFLMLGLPIVLIMVRYTVEIITVWFGAGQRNSVSPAQAMMQPYPRIIVLHVAVLIGFVVTLRSATGSQVDLPASLARLLDQMDAWGGQGVGLVLVLVVLKTIADVWTTWRATRL